MKRSRVFPLFLAVVLLAATAALPNAALANVASSGVSGYSINKYINLVKATMTINNSEKWSAGYGSVYKQGVPVVITGSLKANVPTGVKVPSGQAIALRNIKVGVFTDSSASQSTIPYATIAGPISTLNLNTLDSQLRFDSLTPGRYYFCVKATAAYYYTSNKVFVKDLETAVVASLAFDIVEDTSAASSAASFAWTKQPNLGGSVTSVTYGRTFVITGTLQATFPIAKVIASVHDAAGNAYSASTRKELNVSSGSKTFNMSAIDPYIHMEVLPRGTWYFTIRAYDSKGNHGQNIWWAKKFTVK